VPGAVEEPAPEGAVDPAAVRSSGSRSAARARAVVVAVGSSHRGRPNRERDRPRDARTVRSVTIIPGLLDFIHVQNSGVAFGILNDAAMNHQLKSILTTALAALALIGIGFYARTSTVTKNWRGSDSRSSSAARSAT
jgi:hypothetical protein